MAVTIQVRVDDELKAKSDELFKELGTDTTTAIRIFLTQAISQNGFPFEIKRHTCDAPTDDFVGRGFARLVSLAGSTHTLCPLLRGSLL